MSHCPLALATRAKAHRHSVLGHRAVLRGTDSFLWGTPLKPQGPGRSNTSSWAWSKHQWKIPHLLRTAMPSAASHGSTSLPSHLMGACQVPGLSHATTEPAHLGDPKSSNHLLWFSFPRGRFLSSGTFTADTAERATKPAGIGHAWPTGTQCAAWLSTLLSRAARLYKYHSLWNHRTQVPASPTAHDGRHHSPCSGTPTP